MTGREPNKDNGHLARLYREQADIEPGPGVDQRIRARAKAETRMSGSPRPVHWLGGVAVAASLFVVVSIVTNIRPPAARLPAGESDRTSAIKPVAVSDQAESSSLSSQQARSSEGGSQGQVPRDRAAAPASKSASREDQEARVETHFGHDGPSASEMLERWSETGPSPDDALEPGVASNGVTEEELRVADEKTVQAGRSLWLIERLISVGNAQRARVELDEFRERYPEREIPPELISALERLESSSGRD